MTSRIDVIGQNGNTGEHYSNNIDYIYECTAEFTKEAWMNLSTLKEKMKNNPLSTQVGGNHYTKMAIQPVEYILANGIGFCEGNVIKYVSRWKAKGGIEDLKKARHFIDMLIEHEEGEK